VHELQHVAADVTHGMVCVCVFGTGVSCIKWMNSSRCHLEADSCGPSNHILDEIQIQISPREWALLRGTCRCIATYLGLSKLQMPRVTVPTQHTQWMNVFTGLLTNYMVTC